MWAIRKNCLDTDKDCTLVSSITWDEEKAQKRKLYFFQLRDDDDETYFEGVSTNCDSEKAFDPLGDYGVAFGCTSIWYWDDAQNDWAML